MGVITKTSKNANLIKLVGACFVVIAIVLLFYVFMKGEVSVTGKNPGVTKNVSLACQANGLTYPFLEYDYTNDKIIDINIVFDDSNIVESIFLMQTMRYDTEKKAIDSSVQNSVFMGSKLGKDGFNTDDFAVTFTHSDKTMTMTLFSTAANLSDLSNKYFLAEGMDERSSLDDFLKHYENKGFVCKKK